MNVTGSGSRRSRMRRKLRRTLRRIHLFGVPPAHYFALPKDMNLTPTQVRELQEALNREAWVRRGQVIVLPPGSHVL